MSFTYGERIVITRDGVTVADTFGGIDPYENRLVLPYDVDVAGGDVASFRGLTRRVNAEPMRWLNPFTGWEAGVLAPFEPAPIVMPDLAVLRRPSGVPVADEVTGELTYPLGDVVWTGPVNIEPGIGQGTNVTDLATERISNMTHVATVPMECTAAMPDDLLYVTSSRDARLSTRTLVVIGVRLNSNGFTRDLLVRDNQG